LINGGALSASATFTLNANRGILLGPTGTNSASNNGPASGSGTLDAASAQTLSYAGILASATSTNFGGLIKTGNGTLSLSGANTYTGDTTISEGTLKLTGSGTIGSGTNLIINAGGTLDVSALGGGFTLTSASKALRATNDGTATVTGNLTLSGAVVLALSYTNGSPAINVTGGALTLAAANPLTITVSNGGVLLSGGSYTLISKGAGGSVAGVLPTSITLSGDVTNTATVAITGGELVLSVPATTYYNPVLSGISQSAGNNVVLAFSGTNGQPYKVLSSTNVATPLSNWVSIATGTLTGLPMTYTNGPATNAQRFYIITSP